ncbi:hypothetical protein V5F53_04970 [Xanthobacter sp. V4C-4]|uniref:hypothetical protein n=1 Tax=Xanthobacter cornucopiae TaxID=3119924 RepID=UPI0037269F83
MARYPAVHLRPGGADPQLSRWLERRNHIQPAVHRADDAVRQHPARAWMVAVRADLAATSPRNLSRLFNADADMSVVDQVSRDAHRPARELGAARGSTSNGWRSGRA